MKILITGGSGFLGKSILNSKNFKKYRLLAPTSKKLDLKDKEKIKSFFKKNKFDWIINCAVKGGRRNKPDLAIDYFNNVVGLSNLLEYVNDNCKLITFSSGAEIYKLDTFYGLSKLKCTNMVRHNPNIINIRIYNIFGKYGMTDSFVFNTIKCALQNDQIEIWEDKYFDVYPVENLIQIIDSLISSNIKEYKEFDSVYIKKYKLSEIAKMICYILKSNSKIVVKRNSTNDYIGKGSELTDNLNLENLYSSIYNLIDSIRNEKL